MAAMVLLGQGRVFWGIIWVYVITGVLLDGTNVFLLVAIALLCCW